MVQAKTVKKRVVPFGVPPEDGVVRLMAAAAWRTESSERLSINTLAAHMDIQWVDEGVVRGVSYLHYLVANRHRPVAGYSLPIGNVWLFSDWTVMVTTALIGGCPCCYVGTYNRSAHKIELTRTESSRARWCAAVGGP